MGSFFSVAAHQPPPEATEEQRIFSECARRTSLTIPGNKCFMFGVVGSCVRLLHLLSLLIAACCLC